MKRKIFAPLLCVAVSLINFSGNTPQTPTSFFETETESLEALAYLGQINSYPNADITPGNYFPAWQSYKNNFAQSNHSRSATWENIGPNNVGGRTVSIAIDPFDTSVVYMGSASGGIWKSTTGGIGVNAWTYLPTGFPVLGVGAIAINPDNPNEIFIGTGETYSYGTSTNGLITRTERGSFGIGILKTGDGGLTWQLSLDWTYQENRGVWDIVFDPTDPSVLFAATTEGIYKSTDGGETWNLKLDKKMVMDLDINPQDPSVLFAGVGNLTSVDKGIYKSTDGGEIWNLLTGGGLPAYTEDGRISISHSPSNPDVLIAVIGNAFSTKGIYKTINSGATWTTLDPEEVVSYQGWYAKANLIHAETDQKILLGGVELFKSTNGGLSLTQQTEYIGPDSPMHPDIHDIIANPLNPDLVYIITDGGLFRSNDFGESFYPCNDGYVTSQFYIGSMSSQSNVVGLGGLQDNFTQRYVGTNYWEAKIGADGTFNAIDFNDDEIQYASYQYANVLKSYDQGDNFYEQIYYPVGASAFAAPFIVCPSSTNVLLVGDTKLHRSDNEGDLFTTPNPGQADSGNVLLSIAVSTYSTDTIYYSAAGISGRADLYRSFDGGETVEAITNGLPDRYYRDIALNKNNANELVVCLSGFGTPHIYRSENAGDTWTDISTSLPDVPFHSVLFDPIDDSILYAGNDFNVFVSFDKGSTWEILGEDWPDAAMVFDLIVSPSDQKLIACTHGHGVYRTDLQQREQPTNLAGASGIDLQIYPTLVTTQLSINGLTSDFEIGIFDVRGNIVVKKILSADQNQVDCSALPPGNYFIRVISDGHTEMKKFVKI